MNWYQVVTNKFCAGFACDENNIIRITAPILNKFKGQSINNLNNWIQRFPKHEIIKLKED